MNSDPSMDEQASRTAVAEHASPLGSWRMELLAPSEPLAPFVRRFNAYSERDAGFARRRELPSRLATLVFNLGSDLRVELPLGTRTTFRAGAAFYTGLSAAYAVTETDRAQEGAQVCSPGTAFNTGRPLPRVPPAAQIELTSYRCSPSPSRR